MRTHTTLVASLLALVPVVSAPARPAPAHNSLLSTQATVRLGGLQTKVLSVDAYQPIHLSLIADTTNAVEVAIFDQHGRLMTRRAGAGAVDMYLGPTGKMLKAEWQKAQALKAKALQAEAEAQKAAALKLQSLSAARAAATTSADVYQPSADIVQTANSTDPAGGGSADVYQPSNDVFTSAIDPVGPVIIDVARPANNVSRPDTGGPCTYRIEIRNLSFRPSRLALIADVVN